MNPKLLPTLALLTLLFTPVLRAQPAPAPPLLTGADQTDKYIPYLKGKRVAIVANPASRVGDESTVDVLLTHHVNLKKIFGPEHGFRGNASNGTTVADEIDPQTRLPVISLYGKKRKPSKEDLADVDVVIFDLQSVGVRFYTQNVILRDVMDACAQHGLELLVLDRPNPNGYLVDGPVLDMSLKSGIGQFPIPIAHGLTLAELARMINGQHWLPENRTCKLKIIPCANYTHDTPYVLPVKPSPNLNTEQSVLLYPSTCLFEGTILNHGRGTQTPFCLLGAPALKGRYPFSFTPHAIPGMAEDPVHQDQPCYGLDLRHYDTNQLRQKRQLNLTWMIELYNAYPDKPRFFDQSYHKQIGNIDKLAGTRDFKNQIIAGLTEAQIRQSWEPALSDYKDMRKKYLLYP